MNKTPTQYEELTIKAVVHIVHTLRDQAYTIMVQASKERWESEKLEQAWREVSISDAGYMALPHWGRCQVTAYIEGLRSALYMGMLHVADGALRWPNGSLFRTLE